MEAFVSNYNGPDASAGEQFLRLSELITGELLVPVHHAEPTRPRQGRVVVADGTDWDPLVVGVPRLVWYNGTDWVALDA